MSLFKKNNMIKFLSKIHWTRYITAKYHGTEYQYEKYLGFYVSASPCAVGGVNTGMWNRNKKMTLELGIISFNWTLK